MKTIKLLVVEDDEIARENAVEYLKHSYSNVYEAKDGLEALCMYNKYHPDIIISDIQMPKISGLELIKKIRENDETTQVIITSAYSTKEYLLKAIELKLVKYLIKPIEQKVLDEALLLCCENIKNQSNVIVFKDGYLFDTYNQTLVHKEEIIKLRTKELLLLELLLKYKTRYVTYEEIENYVWIDDIMSKDALKTLIKNLKSKLPKETILNLSKTGYKIDV